MSIDPRFTLEALQALVRIDSRNPGLDPDGPGERELAIHVRDLLEREGWPVALHELGDRRANVVARMPGRGAGPSLMINVHLDTVGVAGMADPFSGDHREGRVWGRGAQDTKGGMAAVLALARALARGTEPLGGELVLAFVADEEHESIGTAELLRHVRTDGAIVIEPSDLDVVVGHRGLGVFRVRTRGRTAHGGRPDLGVDANVRMGYVLTELEGLRRRWLDIRHEALGSPSLHVPVVAGGRHLFVYSEECHADVECRTIPGQTSASVQRELEELLERLAARVEGLQVELEPVLWRPPHEIDPGRPIVRVVRSAAEAVRGAPVPLAHHGWWEDSGLIGEAGIDTVVLGPRGGGLHTEEEWVDVDSVVDLGRILLRCVRAFCGSGEGDVTERRGT